MCACMFILFYLCARAGVLLSGCAYVCICIVIMQNIVETHERLSGLYIRFFQTRATWPIVRVLLSC